MGSFKANGREQGSRERRNIKHARRRGLLNLEWLLEERVLLSVVWHPTSTNLADVENGPMANLGDQAISLYEAFQGGQTNCSALAKQFPLDQFQGDSVLMGLTASTDFQGFETSLSNLGMQIVDTNPTDGLVDGWLPINELPTAAQLPQTLSAQADYKSEVFGAAINEADYSTFANVASQQNGLTGAGVTVGVISDSFNNQGGYAADVASGDLPSNVDDLADATAADPGYPFDDEGRAMAQNIYHIAPGAGLAFATAGTTDQVMAQNILALANTAGAKVIVDDVGFGDEPFFQPCLITQAINTVTSQGVTYLSAAANEADHGYLSNFRAASGTVTGVGTGTFMNFDPSGGTNLLLPITVNEANTSINFQFDQPWETQEPTGSPGPTSQVDFYVLNAAGTIIASGTNNNVATGVPQQFVTVPTTGSYYVAIQLVSGPNPGHVEFTQFGQVSTNDLIVSQQFGSAGGTYYPTSFGHSAAANTIGVGAVPWWSPTPFLGQNPLASEPFSSSGPEIQVFNASGTASSSPLTVQNPTVTAPDGGNITSNWPPAEQIGFVADTANPPFPGEPATSTNLYATFTPDQANLPSFFGTSSAAPNAAAIVALMLQRVPSATPAQIKDALIESAATTPMNGSAPGTWNAQGGYGLINAVNAIDAIDVLRVLPNNITGVFVGPASFVTDPTQPEGDRANPFPTITDALAAATVGDRIEVLPGVYTENVTLQPFVSIVSADPSSTDTSYVPGDALSTIIRAPAVASATTNVTVTATNLSSLVNTSTGQVFQTEVGGFTIASPLVGDPALGTINPNAIGLYADNSNILIDRDYFIDAGSGILVTTSGASSQAPQIENDGIIGNINGVVVQDGGASNPATTTEVINNTFAYNTTGLVALNSATTGSEQAYVANNIFWQNHDQTLARSGAGVISQTVNKLVLNNNLFSGNGASDTSTAYAAENIGNGFDPTLLGPLAANAAADLGNFTGYPAFVAPYDPRPGSDGPATFLLDANFGLLSTSAAINNALESVATKTDFLGNPENPNPTTMGFKLPGYGPRDVGAFEYEPPPTPTPTPVLPAPITPAPAPAPTKPPVKQKHTAPVKKHKVVPPPKHKTAAATPIRRKPPTFPGKSAKKK